MRGSNHVRLIVGTALTAFLAVVLVGATLWAAAPPSRVDESGDDEVAAPTGPRVEISPREPWNEAPTLPAVPEAATAADPEAPISVLVHLDPRTDRLERPGIKSFAVGRGAFTKYEYDRVLPNVINIRNLPRKEIEALRSLPGVVKVEEDYEVTIQHNDSMPLIRAYQSQIQAAGFSGVDGTGVRVCVIDTGIDSNSIMYSGRIDAAAGWDFVNNDSNPEDDNGHGSHVSGTVLGGFVTADFGCEIGPESMQGVAPASDADRRQGAQCRRESGSASNIIAGVNRCASPTLPGGQADVINLSLGGGQFSGSCDTDTIAIACNNAVNAGVVVVAAAGNSNFANAVSTPGLRVAVRSPSRRSTTTTTPAASFPTQTSFSFCTNASCTTTCTDNNPVVDQRCCFSNRSSMLDVAAPGCIIFSNDSTRRRRQRPRRVLRNEPGLTARGGPRGAAARSRPDAHAGPGAAVHSRRRDRSGHRGLRHVLRLRPHRRDQLADSSPRRPRAARRTRSATTACSATVPRPASPAAARPARPRTARRLSCTSDSCNESTDSCNHVPSNAVCDDGLFCNGAETCSVTLGCQAGTDPCSGQSCDETNIRAGWWTRASCASLSPRARAFRASER